VLYLQLIPQCIHELPDRAVEMQFLELNNGTPFRIEGAVWFLRMPHESRNDLAECIALFRGNVILRPWPHPFASGQMTAPIGAILVL
jgi:hypothetical protein